MSSMLSCYQSAIHNVFVVLLSVCYPQCLCCLAVSLLSTMSLLSCCQSAIYNVFVVLLSVCYPQCLCCLAVSLLSAMSLLDSIIKVMVNLRRFFSCHRTFSLASLDLWPLACLCASSGLGFITGFW